VYNAMLRRANCVKTILTCQVLTAGIVQVLFYNNANFASNQRVKPILAS
jgi:hypothetical protein